MSFTSKLPNLGVTIFTRMSQLTTETGAINLFQGFPDFDAPLALRKALGHYTLQAHNQYAPMIGCAPLREQVAKKIHSFYGETIDAQHELTITPEATQAIFCAIQTVTKAGDEVIVFDPCYDSYEPAIKLAGATCVHVPLSLPDFKIDWQCFKDSITTKTCLIILNSPHNPSGALISKEDLTQLTALLHNKAIYVISDEVYEHLVFDHKQHISVINHPELFAKAFVISSYGKSFHATGWKIGYVAAPRLLTEEFRKIHQYVSFSVATPMQYALADFMENQPKHLQQLADFYQQKRDLFCQLIKPSVFGFTPTAGTYFQLLDYSAIQPSLTDVQMVEWLAQQHGIAAIPISVFYHTPPTSLRFIRLCFAKQHKTLQEAAEKLCAI